MGRSHRQARHMDGTIAGDRDITIGRDRELFALLRVPIDIDDDLVTRAQDIVLGRGDVHHGLKGQALVVEDITTEDLLTWGRLKIVSSICLYRLITIKQIIWCFLHHLLLELILVYFLRGVILPHPTRVANGLVGCLTHARLLQLLGIFLADVLDLLQRGTLLE